jgi:hypothetical protein
LSALTVAWAESTDACADASWVADGVVVVVVLVVAVGVVVVEAPAEPDWLPVREPRVPVEPVPDGDEVGVVTVTVTTI